MPEINNKNLKVNTNVRRGAKAMKKLAGFFRSTKGNTASSSDEQGFIDVKSLSHQNHAELRKSALTFYLNGLCDILCGPKTMEDPISIVKTVFAIYAVLHDSYVFFNWSEAFNWHEAVSDWRFQETVDVSFLLLNFLLFLHVHTLCVIIILCYCRQCTSFSYLQLHLL